MTDNTSDGTAGLSPEQYYFDYVDYGVFGGMLLLSVITGLYHGCRGRQNTTTQKYLMGSNMQVFPVAMSLIASYVSGVTILGTPAEIYNYGTQYWVIVVPIWIMGFLVSIVYLPVFKKLQVNSSYEYLEMRFDRRMRTLACIMFILDEVMFLPILIYVPALAFNQVTGVNIHIIGTIVCVVCIFYTVIGGLKAVVWTDTLQIVVMFLSVVVVVAVGSQQLGGPGAVWEKARAGGRLIFFNTDPSLYERHTLLSVLVGETFYWTAFNAVNQTMVQRYMSLGTLRQARRSVVLFTAGVSVSVSLCCYAGLLVYASYQGCDPSRAGLVSSDDQLLPVFVMRTVGHLPGMPGLFIAGVFGAALSSLSVVLNSTSAVLLEDFVKGFLRLQPTDRAATFFAKGCALVLGLIALGFIYIVQHLGGVLATASSLCAIAAGTTFGVFSLGMLVPWAESKGALVGTLAGILLSSWISFGSQYATAMGSVHLGKLPVSVESCPFNTTFVPEDPSARSPISSDHNPGYVFPLYRLSYHWITPVGTCCVLVVGMLVSLAVRRNCHCHVHPDLLSPVVSRFLSAKYRVASLDEPHQPPGSFLKDNYQETSLTAST